MDMSAPARVMFIAQFFAPLPVTVGLDPSNRIRVGVPPSVAWEWLQRDKRWQAK